MAPGLYKQVLHFWVNYLVIPGDFYQLASDAGEKVDKHGEPDTEKFEQWEGWVFDRGCLLLFRQKQAEEGDSVAEGQLHAVLLGQELSQDTGLAWGEQQIQTWEETELKILQEEEIMELTFLKKNETKSIKARLYISSRVAVFR